MTCIDHERNFPLAHQSGHRRHSILKSFTDRAVAYRAKQNVDPTGLAMAVVVQKLVPAEAAGVLFTRDPLDPDGKRMLAESGLSLTMADDMGDGARKVVAFAKGAR